MTIWTTKDKVLRYPPRNRDGRNDAIEYEYEHEYEHEHEHEHEHKHDDDNSHDEGSRKKRAAAAATTATATAATAASLIIGGTFATTILLTLPFVTTQFRSPLPYMSTPRKKVLDALEEIVAINDRRCIDRCCGRLVHSASDATVRGDAGNRRRRASGLRFVDLGSGDGSAVLAAASMTKGRYDSCVGIELNGTLWLLSWLRRLLFQPADVRRRCRFVWGDMFSTTRTIMTAKATAAASKPTKTTNTNTTNTLLGEADAVMVFGVTSLMPAIARLIRDECRVGTCVMCYRFRLPYLAPSASASASATTTTTTKTTTIKKNEMGENAQAENNVELRGDCDCDFQRKRLTRGRRSYQVDNYDDDNEEEEEEEHNDKHADERIDGKTILPSQLDARLVYDVEEMRIYELIEKDKDGSV